MRTWMIAALAAFTFVVAGAHAQQAQPGAKGPHGGTVLTAYSLEGEPKYKPGFKNWDYVNPNAPKGGEFKGWGYGAFDSLNPYIAKGVPAGIGAETLMASNLDEQSVQYGLLAETLEVPDDLSWVIYKLRAEAKWWDGTPVTPDDVIFSLDILKTKGRPNYAQYFKNMVRAEKVSEREVRIVFDTGGELNRELPFIAGQIPVLSKAHWEKRDFTATTLEPWMSSGPYRIKQVSAPNFIIVERVPNYWGANLAVNVGQNNFDTMRTDYYLDFGVALEAFKAGAYDYRSENSSLRWATGYDSPAIQRNLIVKTTVPDKNPKGLQGFFLNTRKPMFQDRKVREALQHVLDFEWSNKTLFYDQYKRVRSFFTNSEFEAKGTPTGLELEYLAPFKGQLPAEIFTTEYNPPKTDGTGNNRAQLLKAQQLLTEAGWTVRNGRLTSRTGQPMAIEFLLSDPSFERIVGPIVQNLERLGIQASIRTIDTSQYVQRVQTYDYDVVVETIGQSTSPGNEQRQYWSCEAARTEAADNAAGICDPVIDALIDKVIAAPDRAHLVGATRALDRVLQWGFYVIPNWYTDVFRIAYWDKFGRPEVTPAFGIGTGSWWYDPDRARRLEQARAQLR